MFVFINYYEDSWEIAPALTEWDTKVGEYNANRLWEVVWRINTSNHYHLLNTG